MLNALDAVDHLLLGAADLESAVAWFEQQSGIRAATGGSHPGMGTRNALASLGDHRYLEIIAPDPAQAAFNFHIDLRTLDPPRIVTWAASTDNVDAVAEVARRTGLQVFGPRDGSRARPDGTVLRWRTVGVLTTLGTSNVDPVPFFIQWSAGASHPSSDSPGGCRLAQLDFQHPAPDRLRDVLASLGITATVVGGDVPAIHATIETTRGPLKW
jgi:hypothetical protein